MNWKKLGIVFISFSAFFATRSHAPACAWDDSGDWYYRFFAPEIFDTKGYEPFHFTWDKFYGYVDSDTIGVSDNIDRWVAYCDNMVDRASLRELIYESTQEESREIADYIAANSSQLSQKWQSNKAVRHLTSRADKDFAEYYRLAKKIEPYVYTGSDWKFPNIPYEIYTGFVNALESLREQADREEIRERAGFQLVRLHHYMKEYDRVISAYDQIFGEGSPVSLMAQWAFSHKAGAIRRKGDEAKAAYLFSRVFDICPSRRRAAWLSFRVKDDPTWNAVMGLCKNPSERATLYAMRAINPTAAAIEDVENVFREQPNSKWLDLLLVREINKLEDDILEFSFNFPEPVNTGYFGFPGKGATERLGVLTSFVDRVIASGGGQDPGIWQLGSVYLRFLGGDFEGTLSQMDGMDWKRLSPPQQDALKMMRFVTHVTMTGTLDKAAEDRLYQEYLALEQSLPEEKASMALQYMEDIFYRLYRKQGEPAKALLAGNRLDNLHSVPSHPLVIDMQNWIKTPGKGDYEKYLLRKFGDHWNPDQLDEIRGTLYLGTMDLDKAIEHLSKVEPKNLGKIGRDPFEFHVREKINCWDDPACNENKYNKLTVAKLLKKMTELAREKPEKAGEYYFLIGTAYFNMSYYGGSWEALDYHRSSFGWIEAEKKPGLYHTGWDGIERTDVTLAKKYFDLAISNSKNPEISAMACFGASKCRQAEYWQSPDYEWPYSYVSMGYGEYFTRLKNEFSNTEFYQQAINECLFFGNFARW